MTSWADYAKRRLVLAASYSWICAHDGRVKIVTTGASSVTLWMHVWRTATAEHNGVESPRLNNGITILWPWMMPTLLYKQVSIGGLSQRRREIADSSSWRGKDRLQFYRHSLVSFEELRLRCVYWIDDVNAILLVCHFGLRHYFNTKCTASC